MKVEMDTSCLELELATSSGAGLLQGETVQALHICHVAELCSYQCFTCSHKFEHAGRRGLAHGVGGPALRLAQLRPGVGEPEDGGG